MREDRAPEPVRSFGTFTADLHRLVDWFTECGVETVVMESTSVYWIPIFELLDARGFIVFLVNARDAKHVPGRKTDVSDAQWLQRRRQNALVPNAPIRRPGGGSSALAAVTVGRTDTALGAFYRRLSARIGKAKAVTATARKIAVLFYNAVRYGMDYLDPGASSYETRYRTRVVNNLHRRAKAFGFVLQRLEPKVGAAVS
jgi:hypothetical protein